MAKINGYPKNLLLKGIKVYQWLFSPWVGQSCRFYPSCSKYAHTSIERYGALRGSILTIARLSKCHPWHPGGVDEVP